MNVSARIAVSSCCTLIAFLSAVHLTLGWSALPSHLHSRPISTNNILRPVRRASILMTTSNAKHDDSKPTPHAISSDGTPTSLASATSSTGRSNKKTTWFTKIGSTTSAVVAGTFFIVLAWKRDALMVSFFIGSISNGILSKVLKKLLKQERPAELVTSDLDLPPSDNGMPSSHAMSLGFIGTFTALQLPWTSLPLILYVIVSLVYRVQSKLHTPEQIAVGITVGSLNGYIWQNLCFGTNPLGVNVMDWVSDHFLNDRGLLPWYGLAIPALVGAAVVGSVERRISHFLGQRSKTE